MALYLKKQIPSLDQLINNEISQLNNSNINQRYSNENHLILKKKILVIQHLNQLSNTMNFSSQNNSFYTDIDCKIEINDVPKKIPDLSELYKNGRQVISYNSYNLILQSMSIVKQDEDKTSYVYFNLLDNNYYWDRSCNEPIVGGIDAIGYLEGNKVKAFDGNIYIVKTTDIDKVLEDYIQNIK